ncbi:Microcystin-dependent protein [Rhizobiales bacterium GAS191]|jgi:microcystin-dependent protein|nr:Microcystin-dependent protein [Rhizobiales bacterium GAS113]SEC97331.1 Microcystin-dependent protein [Rhizobiales bacterium GAS191]
MSAPYVGEIRMFGGNFSPAGWMFCDGTQLPISNYDTLFNLIGTTYGGDGQTTFNLPDLRGRVPIHQGTFSGDNFVIGQNGGVETVTLTTQQIPQHNHALFAASSGQQQGPSGSAIPAAVVPATDHIYGPTGSAPTTLVPASIGPAGGNQPHNNIQPFQAINFIISLFGIFPSQN